MKLQLSLFKRIRIQPSLQVAWFGVLVCIFGGMVVVATYGALVFVRVSKADTITVEVTDTAFDGVRHTQFDEAIAFFSQRVEAFERLRSLPPQLPDIGR